VQGMEHYNPGTTQLVHVTVSNPDSVQFGFQLTARFVTGGAAQMAGSFTAVNADTKVVCGDASTPADSKGVNPCPPNALLWIEQARSPQVAGTAQRQYTFDCQWQTPAQENGDIIVYASAVAAGLTFNSNEHVYATSFIVPLSPTSSCPINQKPVLRTAYNA